MKCTIHERNIDKLDAIIIKIFCSVKNSDEKMRRHRLWENITKDTCDKRLLSKIYKELLKLNNKKTTAWLKHGPKNLTNTSPKKIHKWQRTINIWKRAPFNMASGKGKFPGGSALKRLPGMRETRVWSLGRENPLEKEMATHSSTLAWEIPRTEEPGGLQSTTDWLHFHFLSLSECFTQLVLQLLPQIYV